MPVVFRDFQTWSKCTSTGRWQQPNVGWIPCSTGGGGWGGGVDDNRASYFCDEVNVGGA